MDAAPAAAGWRRWISMPPDVIATAVTWLQQTLLGTLATTIAIVAVAGLGFQTLSGRIDLRSAARVLLGCFILFGAASIAAGMRQLAVDGPIKAPVSASVPDAGITQPATPFDPYAGAAVPER